MGVFDRLGYVIKSYLNDDDEKIFGRTRGEKPRGAGGDPDLDAAFDELNDFLNGGPAGGARKKGWRGTADEESGGGWERGGTGGAYHAGKANEAAVPEALRRDFAELGLAPDASAEDCKAAYKKLLKIHHPDRHAGHEGNMKKATEKSARINAAYDRIAKWRETGAL